MPVFARLHSSQYATVPISEPATITNEDDEIHARRKAVEAAMELYVLLKDDPLRIKLNAAVLAAVKDMRFRTGSAVHTWFEDFGVLVARMHRACGPCHPPGRTGRCVHATELETAARLKIRITNGRTLAGTFDTQLGSPTRRKRLGKEHVAEAEQRRVTARRDVEAASNERRSIIHRSTYAEGCEMLWFGAASDRAYLFRLE